jgi:hypothetical protein
VLHRPLVGPMVFFPESGVLWFAYLLAGQAVFRDQPTPMMLEQGDSAVIRTPDGGARTLLDGGGEVLLVRISEPLVG